MADTPDMNAIACRAMGIPVGTKVIRCVIHGQHGRPEDVHELNNWEHEAGGGISCVPDHPYCFGWASPDLVIPNDYCEECGAFIGEGGMIAKAGSGLCVECDDEYDNAVVSPAEPTAGETR